MNFMGVDATSESSDNGSNGSFGNAVKLGLTLGLFPGAILGIAYMFMPSITSRDDLDLIGTAAFFILFSSLLGGVVGIGIYLVNRSAMFVLWALNLLAGSALSICILLESSVFIPLSVLIVPIYLVSRQYFSDNLPKWIKEAMDRVMVELLVGIFLAGLVFFLDPLTGNSFSELVKPNLNIFAEQILRIYHDLLHR
jgi:hypothetical protein